MTKKSAFQKNITEYRKRIVITHMVNTLSTGILISLGIITVILYLDWFTQIHIFNIRNIILISSLSLISSCCYRFLKKKNFRQELIDMDKRLKFHDSISTAYELNRTNDRQVFFNFILDDALRYMESLNLKDIFPLRLPNSLILAPVFITLMTVLFFLDTTSEKANQIKNQNPVIMETGHRISEYLNKPDRDAGPSDKESIRKKASRLSSQFISEDMSLDHALKKLKHLKADFQNTNYRKISRLENDLNTEFSSKMNQNINEKKQSGRNRLETLKKKISNAFDNKIPVKIKKSISQLEQDTEFEEFLNMTIESMNRASREEKAKELARQKEIPNIIDKSKNIGNRDMNSDSPLETQNKFGDNSQGDNDTGQGNAESYSSGGNTKGESKAEDSTAYTAGNKPSENISQKPGKIQPSESEITKVEGLQTSKGKMSFMIRTLTAMGNTSVPEETLIKSYRKQVEDVLLKEDIPPEHMAYIKRYFLSIGVTEN